MSARYYILGRILLFKVSPQVFWERTISLLLETDLSQLQLSDFSYRDTIMAAKITGDSY